MSGHSKWSQIKRQKGTADLRRGQLFGKLAKAIIVAAKNGNDSNTNLNLKVAIEKAHAINMPKESIDRAIKRGSGEIEGTKIEEVLYEAIGPARIVMIIEAATDNKNRTTAEIKNTLNKYQGKLAGAGAVTYQFDRMGKLVIEAAPKQEEIELKIIDLGAEDFEEQNGEITVYTRPEKLSEISKALEDQKISVKEASLSWEPKNVVKIEDEKEINNILTMMEKIENLDDVVAIYPNFDLPKEMI
ncbi:MAG: YebC/PmpR family DNA-binding transcriptional regulator [Patescibacteria group bacterium]